MSDQILTSVGNRIKSARRLLGFSRKDFEEKFGISAATLQAWEDEKYKVSAKGISRFIAALRKAGLLATPDWFFLGIGVPPQLISNNNLTIRNNYEKENITEDEIILREVSFFEKINEAPIIQMISDDTMIPIFCIGDYVGGNLIPGKFANKYVGSYCIIRLENGEIYIRKIKQGSSSERYHLISVNLDSNASNAYLLDCKIDGIAQIVWHRKNEKISK